MFRRRERSYSIDGPWDVVFLVGCVAVSAFGITYGLIEYARWGNARIVDRIFGEQHDPYCRLEMDPTETRCDCGLERPL